MDRLPEPLLDLLLPATDRAVAIQVLVVLGAGGVALWLLRRRSEWRIFTTGLVVLVLGLMGLRALH